MRPASQNPYSIYDQNLWFSLPYLWSDSYIIRGRAFVAGFIYHAWQAFNGVDEGKARMGEGGRDEEVASSEKKKKRIED